MRRTLLAPALLLALAAGAPPAAARAPTVSEQGSLDWILERLGADRAEDQKGPRVDPLEKIIKAYQSGETPLDEWPAVADIVWGKSAPPPRPILRPLAASALIDRMQAEGTKSPDFKVLRKVKKDVCLYLLKIMNSKEDLVGRNLIWRLLNAFFPQSKIEWKPEDSIEARNRAYADLKKYLEKQ